MPHRALAVVLLTYALSVQASRADMTYAHKDAVETVTAGYFCLTAPDAAKADIGGKGKVGLFHTPFRFEAESDTLTSQPGIGIGVVARLGPLLRDTVLTARESHGNPCCGPEQSWLTRARPDGLIWLGHLEGVADFPPGVWRFSLWRGPDQLFSYDITVLPADANAPRSCERPTS